MPYPSHPSSRPSPLGEGRRRRYVEQIRGRAVARICHFRPRGLLVAGRCAPLARRLSILRDTALCFSRSRVARDGKCPLAGCVIGITPRRQARQGVESLGNRGVAKRRKNGPHCLHVLTYLLVLRDLGGLGVLGVIPVRQCSNDRRAGSTAVPITITKETLRAPRALRERTLPGVLRAWWMRAAEAALIHPTGSLPSRRP